MKTSRDLKPEEWIALWGTYSDGLGGVIDWSGISAIGLCKMCDHVTGICFSEDDAKKELAFHRQYSHPSAHWAEDMTCTVPGCTMRRHTRGICYRHVSTAREAWADTIGPWCDAWECDRGATTKGLCTKHYQRRLNGKDVYSAPPPPEPAPEPEGKRKNGTARGQVCQMDECDSPVLARYLCRAHYQQAWYRARKDGAA